MKLNRKMLLASTAILALAGAAVVAQVTLPTVTVVNTTDDFPIIVGGQPSAQSQYMTLARMRSAAISGSGAHTSAPTLTGCVTSGGTTAGTDFAFILTQGSAANTSCTATFATHFNSTPVCVVSDVSNVQGPQTVTLKIAVSTTALVLTQASLSSQVYDVICAGRPGG